MSLHSANIIAKGMEEALPFQHDVLPERGRALVATRAIKPGEEVLREHCAAMVHTTANKVEDCHLMFARIQVFRTGFVHCARILVR